MAVVDKFLRGAQVGDTPVPVDGDTYVYRSSDGLWHREQPLSQDQIRALSKTIQYGFSDNNAPYVEKNTTTWVTVADFEFLGTNVFTPTEWNITVGRSGITGVSEARLVVPLALPVPLVITTISWTDDVLQIVSNQSALINLPATLAVLEIQIRKQTSQSKSTRIFHSVIE